MKSDRVIKEALKKLPTGIYATYDEIIQQLCTQYPENIGEIKTILRWLIGSITPITLDQLAEAVSIRPRDKRLERDGIANDVLDLVACCGSLATLYSIDMEDNHVDDLRGSGTILIKLSHASVEDYFMSSNLKVGPSSSFFMDLPSVHLEIAKTCLQYIGFQDFQKPVKFEVKQTSTWQVTVLMFCRL